MKSSLLSILCEICCVGQTGVKEKITNESCLAPNLDKEVKGLVSRAELVGRRADKDSAVGQLATPDNQLHSHKRINSADKQFKKFQSEMLKIHVIFGFNN